MSNEQIRADFESRKAYVEWYVSEFGRQPIDSGYESDITWKAWQAAHARYAGSAPTGNGIKETNRSRWVFVIAMVLWMVAIIICSPQADAAKWETPITVTYSIKDRRLLDMLDYTVWQIRERAGVSIQRGFRARAPELGTIQVMLITDAEMDATRGAKILGATQRWYDPNLDRITRAQVIIRVSALDRGCAQRIVTHEIIHALGYPQHSDAESDIMYHSIQRCMYTSPALTTGDMNILESAGYDVDRCFAELMPDGSVYAPHVGGYTAHLSQQWDGLWRFGPLENGDSCAGVVDGDRVYLDDIRAADGGRYSAELRIIGDFLQLVGVEQK